MKIEERRGRHTKASLARKKNIAKAINNSNLHGAQAEALGAVPRSWDTLQLRRPSGGLSAKRVGKWSRRR